ncbi:hypothetical protein H6B26_29035 [Bacillus cereus]|nr:hypothetical protein [Bacillus cereus]
MDEAIELLHLCQEAGVNSGRVLDYLHEAIRLARAIGIPKFDAEKEADELRDAVIALTLIQSLVTKFEKEWEKLPIKEAPHA